MEKILEENHTFHAPYMHQFTSHSMPSQASFNENTPSYKDYPDSFQELLDTDDFGEDKTPSPGPSTQPVPPYDPEYDSDASTTSNLPASVHRHIKRPPLKPEIERPTKTLQLSRKKKSVTVLDEA